MGWQRRQKQFPRWFGVLMLLQLGGRLRSPHFLLLSLNTQQKSLLLLWRRCLSRTGRCVLNMNKCVTHLDAVPHAVQLLVVDWSAAVRWAGLRTGRRRREDLVATWNATHRREGADFSPRHFLFVHLHHLKHQSHTQSPVGGVVRGT